MTPTTSRGADAAGAEQDECDAAGADPDVAEVEDVPPFGATLWTAREAIWIGTIEPLALRSKGLASARAAIRARVPR